MVLPHLQNNHRNGSGRCGPNNVLTAIIFFLAVILIVINYGDDVGMISNEAVGVQSSTTSEFYGIEERDDVVVVETTPEFHDNEEYPHPSSLVMEEVGEEMPEERQYAHDLEPASEPEMIDTTVGSPPEEQAPSNNNVAASTPQAPALPSVDFNCEINPAQPPSQPITPVYAASYPGSGAKLTSKLIEALTGIPTGDDFNSNEETNNVVSIKTYYPHPLANNVVLSSTFQRSILIIRNPLNAIPSLHSFVYESENKLPEHSVRAPMDLWVEWREQNFASEINAWAGHIRSWMYRSESKSDRLVIAFERLADENLGPLEVTRLAEFLAREDGVSTRQPEEMPCIWWKVANFKQFAKLLQAQNWNGGTRQLLLRRRKLQEAGFVPPPASGEKIVTQIREDADAKREAAKEAEEAAQQFDLNSPQLTEEQMAKQQEQQMQQQQPYQQEQEELLAENSFSIRGGAKYLPTYTDSQLQVVIDIISNLLFEFENEQTLSAALTNYINDAKKRLELLKKENEYMLSNIAAAVENGAPPPNENQNPLT